MFAFLLLFVTLGRLYRDMFKQPETRALMILALLVLGVGVVFYTNAEHWSLVNAIYFCVVTLGTVGYGDITPTTAAGKLFTVIYIILGLSVIGGFFATLGRMIDPQRFLSLGGGAQEMAKLREELARVREEMAHLAHRAEDRPAQAPSAETDQS
jgi:voltage-gated potassium channel